MLGVTAARPAPPRADPPPHRATEVKSEDAVEAKTEPEDEAMAEVTRPAPALRASIDSDNRSDRSDDDERRTRKRPASPDRTTPDAKRARAQCAICRLHFDTQRALELHRFTSHGETRAGFDDLTFVDFTSGKFAEIARGICERSRRVSLSEPRYSCERCERDFPCGRALDMHRSACAVPARPASPQRERREDFFAKLDLRNRVFAGTLTPPLERFAAKHYDEAAFSEDGTSRPMDAVRDLADIQSILNVTAAGGLLERLTGTRVSLESAALTPPDTGGKDREPEESQDRFAAEFRRMKLRGEFPCRLCPAKFPNLRALKGHNRVHLSGTGPGPYRCNMCPHASLDKAALVRHMRTHNGDRPYECAVCNYAFTTKANCERHLRNRHAKITREDVKRSIIYHPSEDPNNDEVNSKIGREEVKRSLAFHTPEPERRDEATGRDTPLSHFPSFVAEPRRPVVLPTVLPDTPVTTPREDPPLPRIKVKGIGQLTQIPEYRELPEPENFQQNEDDEDESYVDDAPVDLSTSDNNDCDVLDLSKKKRDSEEPSPQPTPIRQQSFELDPAAVAAATFEKTQRLLLAQRRLFENTLPKIDTAFYASQLSQMYPGVPGLPGLSMPPSFPVNPYFLQHPFFPPATDPQELAEIKERIQKEILRGLRMSGGGLVTPEPEQARIEIVEEDQKPVHIDLVVPPVIQQPTRPESPRPRREPNLPQTDSVKMVIKNGVLMPKQKQRRYRTERPFSCSQCSARFTLRSNMERHVKQQHPQHWSVRRPSPRAPTYPGGVDNLAERVKFALLSRQLERPLPAESDRSPVRRDSDDVADNEEDEDDALIIDEEEPEPETGELTAAHRAAAEILMATRQQELAKDFDLKIAGNLISKPQVAVLETEKEKEPSDIADEDTEVIAPEEPAALSLITVPTVPTRSDEEEDEEGLVASTSEENNSGSDENRSETDAPGAQPPKKKSAYSLAPNRVSCPYCHRKFPWSSSLRRHVLTHTGQKPFRCPHCPLLFTTKSNCDRHLLRKHGASARPAIVEPSPPENPSPVQNESNPNFALRNVPERPFKCASCPSSTFSTLDNLKKHMSSRHGSPDSRPASPNLEESEKGSEASRPEASPVASPEIETLAFKCHLCEGSFGERGGALRHLADTHATEYEQLVSKGALEAASDRSESADDDDRGKFPDHANRKVVCAFCVRRFWSAEDLRRHMRTHSGERPFACDLCRRRFTLKHSMLRHRKKHRDGRAPTDDEEAPATPPAVNGYRYDDDSRSPPCNVNNNNSPPAAPYIAPLKLAALRKYSSDGEPESGNEFIGKLLGITDRGIINKLLTSADEAAKLLGVNK